MIYIGPLINIYRRKLIYRLNDLILYSIMKRRIRLMVKNNFSLFQAQYDVGLNPVNSDYHTHNEYELYLQLEKESNYYIGPTCYHLKRGYMLIINNNEIHKCPNVGDMNFRRATVYFNPTYMNNISIYSNTDLLSCFKHPIGKKNLIVLDEEQLGVVVEYIDDMVKYQNSTAYADGTKALIALIRLLVLINRIYSTTTFENGITSKQQSSYLNRIYPIISYIDDHYAENLSLENIANALGMNKYTISHIFKQVTGSTIHNYISLKRISCAKALLLEGKNVTETCYLSGFNDYSNFIRRFKAETGMTPGEYKNINNV